MHMDDEFRIGTVEDTFEFEANYGTAVHLSERSVRVGGPHRASCAIPKRSNFYPETHNREKDLAIAILALRLIATPASTDQGA
jgi:hypothetical protein